MQGIGRYQAEMTPGPYSLKLAHKTQGFKGSACLSLNAPGHENSEVLGWERLQIAFMDDIALILKRQD